MRKSRPAMNEHGFTGEIAKLRNPARLERLQVE